MADQSFLQTNAHRSLWRRYRGGEQELLRSGGRLQPTDFFAVTSDGNGQDGGQDGPEESILELGRRCWHPMRMLEVHCRSRHQSLIAYSNREFYDERLLVYPSRCFKTGPMACLAIAWREPTKSAKAATVSRRRPSSRRPRASCGRTSVVRHRRH